MAFTKKQKKPFTTNTTICQATNKIGSKIMTVENSMPNL